MLPTTALWNALAHGGLLKVKFAVGHLGIKLKQSTYNKGVGRPRGASDDDLLRSEGLWVDTFRGLRDGNPEIETEVPAVPSMFIKRSGPGQEQLYIEGFGKPPRVIRQPKFSTTPDELLSWRSRVQKEQEQFDQAILNPVPARITAAAIPSERQLWEALKRPTQPLRCEEFAASQKYGSNLVRSFRMAAMPNIGRSGASCTEKQGNFAGQNLIPDIHGAMRENQETIGESNISPA
jgi:hypothetical protein